MGAAPPLKPLRMKTRNTIVLLLFAVGVFAFIHFYESKLPSTQEAADQQKHVVNLDRDKITGITLTNNEEKIVLQKTDGKWMMTAPVKDRADDNAVSTLLTSVETLNKDTTLEGGEGRRQNRHESHRRREVERQPQARGRGQAGGNSFSAKTRRSMGKFTSASPRRTRSMLSATS